MTYQTQAQQFLADIFTGKLPEALVACAEDVVFISTRPEPSEQVRAYGRYSGHAGAIDVFQAFGEMLEPGEFEIYDTIAQGQHVMMYGRLKHIARATGRPFASDWALVMKFDEAGKLALYHFYEDTAALEWALGVNE